MITLTDYIDGEFSVVINSDVQARIDELRELQDDANAHAEKFDSDIDFSDDDLDELQALVAFQDEITRRFDVHFDDVTIVPDDELADFLKAEAADRGDIQEHLEAYVDWDHLARDSKGDFQLVVFNDDEHYLIRSY